MKIKNEKLVLFIIATLVTFYGIGSYLIKGTKADEFSINVQDVDVQRTALLETAHAYYRQGVHNQYDSYRKNLYATPEDATSQHYIYTVCSGFTFQTYYQTFGIKIPDNTEKLLDYAEQNKDNKEIVPIFYNGRDIIYSEDVLGTGDIAHYEELTKQWVSILLPGDVIIVTGHAFMVDSVDYENDIVYIIESAAGTQYNYVEHKDNFDENGTVQYRTLETRFRNYYRLITNDIVGDEIERIAVIRFITDGDSYINTNNEKDTYNITSAALSRLKYPNIDIEKTIKNHSQNIMFELGDEIIYQITIKNNSSIQTNPYVEDNVSGIEYDSFSVVENVDPRLEVVDLGGGNLDNNQIKWDFSKLSVGESITINYSVKIPNNSSLLGEMILSTGLVDNIATSKIEFLVGDKLDDSEKEKVYTVYNNLKDNDLIERDFINQIYIDALDLDLGLNNELANLDIIGYDSSSVVGGGDNLSVRYTKVNDISVKKYIFNNFYGLRVGYSNNKDNNIAKVFGQWNFYPTYELNDRARTLTSDMLNDGDIILTYTGNVDSTDDYLVDKSYIYLNNNLIRKMEKDSFEELSGEELTVFLRDIIGDNYIILRPYIDNVLSFGDNINIDEDNMIVSNIEAGITIDEFDSIINTNVEYEILDKDDNRIDDGDIKLKTGDKIKVKFTLGEVIYKVSVNGDVTGDGEITSEDVVKIFKHTIGSNIISDNENLLAADIDKNGKININDIIRLAKLIVNVSL